MTIQIKALISFGLLVLLLAWLPWQELREAAHNITLGIWFAVLCGFLTGHAMSVCKWRMLVQGGRATLKWHDAVRCYGAGLFANLYLPSIVGGDVLRAIMAGRVTARPEAAVIGGLADRLIDVIALGLLMCTGGLLANKALSGWSTHAVALLVLLSLVGISALFPFVLRRPLSRWPIRYWRSFGPIS